MRRVTVPMLLFTFLTLAGCSEKIPSGADLNLYLSAKEHYLNGELEDAEKDLMQISGMTQLQNGPVKTRRSGHYNRVKGDLFPQAVFMLSKVLYFGGRADEAEELLNILLAGIPRYREAEILLCRIELQRSEYSPVMKRLDRLLAFDASDPRLLYLRALTCRGEGDTAAAIDFLRKASLFGGELALVHLELGRIYNELGQREEALKELSRSSMLLPEESILKKPVVQLLRVIRGDG